MEIERDQTHNQTKEHSRCIVLCIFTLTPWKPKWSVRPLVPLVKEKVSCLQPATSLRWRFAKKITWLQDGQGELRALRSSPFARPILYPQWKGLSAAPTPDFRNEGSDRINHVFMSIHPHAIHNYHHCNLKLPTAPYLVFEPVRLVALPAVCH